MTDPHDDDPLPEGWTRLFSKSQGKNYYFHRETKHTQWHFPTASEAKDPLKGKRRAEEAKDREKRHKSDSGHSNLRHTNDSSKRPRVASTSAVATDAVNNNDFLELADSTSVAIIVPYRDLHLEQKRAEHLQKFVPHMIQFLAKCKNDGLVSDFHIYIIEQTDDGLKFNRGKLLNVGFEFAKKSGRKHDVFIFHDVDLLPQDDLAPWYAKFPKTPIHIARVWGRYSNNPKYIGGVASFSSSDYKRINGFPNNYWGWGGEDDEMQRRLERLGIQFEYPDRGTLIDLENMSIQEKMDFLRKNKSWKCMVKWELKDEHENTWKTNGLSDLKYSVSSTANLHESSHATKITVDIKASDTTHWTWTKAGVDFLG